MPARSHVLAVPRLVGRLRLQDIPGLSPEHGEAIRKAWDDAMFELQRYLESLRDSTDITQETLTEIEDTITATEDALSPRMPTPHTHKPADVLGLPGDGGVILSGQTFARSSPTRSDQVVGLLGDVHVILAGQIFGP
jgi:hypothetical protein